MLIDPRQARDLQVDALLGNVLRGGVFLSMLIIGVGATLFLWQHADWIPDYRVFKGEPANLRDFWHITAEVIQLQPLGILQLGVLCLIGTPLARVAACLIVFARQQDLLYVGISSFVLLVLLYSLRQPDLYA